MSEDRQFLVGITPDWEDFTDRMLGDGLREILDPLPDLRYEMMLDTNWTATAESVRPYDAIIHFGYYLPRSAWKGSKGWFASRATALGSTGSMWKPVPQRTYS